ncbi:MAG: GntR family transcriptional regulator [Rubripirellula sp.]
MHIELSLQDGVPIYRQIANQVKYLIASGQLQPGAELPAIRVLAEQLTVTPNTVVKAYGELETSGLIVKRRGSGTYVSDTKSPLARKEQKKILTQRADALLTEAQQLDYTFDEVLKLLTKRQAELEKKQSGSHFKSTAKESQNE